MNNEKDPNGLDQHQPGAKLDDGKNRLGLVLGGFSKALQEVGKVGTYGANKYTDNGWKSVPNGVERYTDAMYRHLLNEAIGERFDKDTGLLHAAHTAWNALAKLDLMLRKSDKPVKKVEEPSKITELGEYILRNGCKAVITEINLNSYPYPVKGYTGVNITSKQNYTKWYENGSYLGIDSFHGFDIVSKVD